MRIGVVAAVVSAVAALDVATVYRYVDSNQATRYGDYCPYTCDYAGTPVYFTSGSSPAATGVSVVKNNAGTGTNAGSGSGSSGSGSGGNTGVVPGQNGGSGAGAGGNAGPVVVPAGQTITLTNVITVPGSVVTTVIISNGSPVTQTITAPAVTKTITVTTTATAVTTVDGGAGAGPNQASRTSTTDGGAGAGPNQQSRTSTLPFYGNSSMAATSTGLQFSETSAIAQTTSVGGGADTGPDSNSRSSSGSIFIPAATTSAAGSDTTSLPGSATTSASSAITMATGSDSTTAAAGPTPIAFAFVDAQDPTKAILSSASGDGSILSLGTPSVANPAAAFTLNSDGTVVDSTGALLVSSVSDDSNFAKRANWKVSQFFTSRPNSNVISILFSRQGDMITFFFGNPRIAGEIAVDANGITFITEVGFVANNPNAGYASVSFMIVPVVDATPIIPPSSTTSIAPGSDSSSSSSATAPASTTLGADGGPGVGPGGPGASSSSTGTASNTSAAATTTSAAASSTSSSAPTSTSTSDASSDTAIAFSTTTAAAGTTTSSVVPTTTSFTTFSTSTSSGSSSSSSSAGSVIQMRQVDI